MRVLLCVILWLGGVMMASAQEDMMLTIKKNPDRYFVATSALIYGHGGPKGIDKAGIELALALKRADVRAAALRKLLLADLDFDGAIDREEMTKVAMAASATARGRLWQMHAVADADGDGRVVEGELSAWGLAQAMQRVSAVDEAETLAVLGFDSDKDGWVSLTELRSGLAALGPKTKS
jgi:hypothetical protein